MGWITENYCAQFSIKQTVSNQDKSDVQPQDANFSWCQTFVYGSLMFFLVTYESKPNIFCSSTAVWTKEDI